MTVPADLSKAILDEEYEIAVGVATPLGWLLERTGDLSVSAKLTARPIADAESEVYVLDFNFDNYRAIPPLIDIVHPKTGARNRPECFPEGGCLSYFHQKQRICAEWSRASYKDFAGPHPEWEYAGWELRSSPPVSSFADMLVELWRAISDPSYTGRTVV